MGLFGSIKAWFSPPPPELVDTPIQSLATGMLLDGHDGFHDGFSLCAQGAERMTFVLHGVRVPSPDEVCAPADGELATKIAAELQARLVEIVGFDGRRPQQGRFLVRLRADCVQPYAAWIQNTPRGERLTIAVYKNDFGERMVEDGPFFEEMKRSSKAHLVKDFENALGSAMRAIALAEIDPYLKALALGVKFTAFAGLGTIPAIEDVDLLHFVDATFGALHPITLYMKADHASDRLKLGQREEALQLWRSVREPYRVIFGEDDPMGGELDALR